MKKIIVTYETQEHAQRAATILGEGNDQFPRVSWFVIAIGYIYIYSDPLIKVKWRNHSLEERSHYNKVKR